MKRTLLYLICLALPFLTLPLFPATKDKPTEPEKKAFEPKPVVAVRTEESVAIDGVLSEKIWQTHGYDEFLQSDPVDGAPPSEKTKVWVAYDDANIYVAAYLYDSQPDGIKRLLGRRDSQLDSDWFVFSVDPYFDRRSGYEFCVNPAGSVIDQVLSNDVSEDTTWDGVWESKAQVNGDGWIVEMRIPLNQLRFPKKDEYVWGVNFGRHILRKQERDRYAWVPKDQIAYVSRFARLEGIKNIHPGPHVEIMPYSVGQAQFKPAETGNPFQTGRKALGNAGLDFKVGLKSNLTLDATVNPDFGQVEVDPAVINLSAYETYYQEKRPFFIEGASIFNGFGRGGVYMNANLNWPSPTFFYSRRIGRSPEGPISHDGFVDYPDRSTILGAFKLTGKLGNSWNIGFINALTAREYAQVDSLGTRFRDEVEPFSYYGAVRVQKDINKGQQGFGLMATGVSRDLGDEGLKSLLNQRAFSLAFDGWTFLDKKRVWVFGGWFGGTRIEGSREDILRLQYSSMHYFQRPDADHVEVDPLATSLSGLGGRFALAKQQGKYLFLANVGVLSPGFDPNDAGFQYGSSDIINISIIPGIQWTKPGKVFRNALIIGGPFRNYDFGGNKTWEGYLAEFEAELLNYWGGSVMLAYNPETVSNRLTRGGPLAAIPPGYQVNLNLYSDNRKAVVLEGSAMTYQRPTESTEWDAEVGLRWKPRSNFNLSFGPGYSYEDSQLMWVTQVPDPLMTSTFGARYVFGRIQQRVLSSDIRLDWIFTPRLSLQLYLQPFIAVGKYGQFKELARPKAFAYNVFGENGSTISRDGELYTVDPDGAGPAAPFTFGNPDFNVKSLRGTAVLRWEYLPGSLLYFVWTQNRADYAHPGDFQFRRDLGDLLTAPGDNIFLLKVSYRWSL
jgi:hypothetical protein